MSSHSDRIAQLEGEVAQLRALVTPAIARRQRQAPRRFVRRLALVGLVMALVIPAGVVLASHRFRDVPATSTFHAHIEAIAAAGVTSGCAADLYCPQDFVTRGQMAAFMNRLGALGSGMAPKVNAKSVNGHQITSGSVASAASRRHLLHDGSTGADVFVTTFGFVEVENTDATRSLVIQGISSRGVGPIEQEFANLDPGESAIFNTDTLNSVYIDLALTLSGGSVEQTKVAHLVCTYADAGGGVPSYTSCIVTGRG